jgi:hypothetical protein
MVFITLNLLEPDLKTLNSWEQYLMTQGAFEAIPLKMSMGDLDIIFGHEEENFSGLKRIAFLCLIL